MHSCDSIVVLTLTVQPALTGAYSQTICAGQSVSFNGLQLNTAGTYADTLQTIGGCDSIVTLTLSVNNVLQTTLQDTICNGDSYLFGGNNIQQSGIYSDTLVSVNGCDSIVTLQLFVNALPVPVIIRSGDTLSTQTFVVYQWLKDGNPVGSGNAWLPMTANGTYAVVVTDANGCSDTSAALQVTGVGVEDLLTATTVNVFPNPNSGAFMVVFGKTGNRELSVTDATGRLILQMMSEKDVNEINLGSTAAGIYFLQVNEGQAIRTFKISVLN